MAVAEAVQSENSANESHTISRLIRDQVEEDDSRPSELQQDTNLHFDEAGWDLDRHLVELDSIATEDALDDADLVGLQNSIAEEIMMDYDTGIAKI
jgi:hypothetical protein